MTCIVSQFGCACGQNECQVPHYRIMEEALFTSRHQLIIWAIAVCVSVSSASMFVMALLNGGL